MAVNLSPVGGVAAQFFTNSGVILSGGKLLTYAAGTTTPAATYTSSNGSTAHTNPIVLNSAGRVPSSGEIWLTDGVSYKFVLTDANDVLIATYDNIVGINSNFVNFTNSQEIQTATAGQTAFTLTTMQYQPGTGSLSVFVDGVNQYGPGAQYAFAETSSTVVTFTNGLHVGASVKFTTSAINASSYGDASQITYDPPFTGSVATNVEAKLAQTVSVKDFGAVGDGLTNDTAAIQAAIIETASGGALYFPAGVYLIDALDTGLIESTWFFDSATLKANSSSAQTYLLKFQGRHCNIYNLKINMDFKTNYDAALWWYNATNASQFNNFYGMEIRYAKRGIVYGEFPGVSSTLLAQSENTLFGYMSYGVERPFLSNHGNGVIDLESCTLSAQNQDWTSGFNTTINRSFQALAGVVNINGGEIQNTIADVTSYAASVDGGTVYINNVITEVNVPFSISGQLFIDGGRIQNNQSLTSQFYIPSTADATTKIVVSNCLIYRQPNVGSFSDRPLISNTGASQNINIAFSNCNIREWASFVQIANGTQQNIKFVNCEYYPDGTQDAYYNVYKLDVNGQNLLDLPNIDVKGYTTNGFYLKQITGASSTMTLNADVPTTYYANSIQLLSNTVGSVSSVDGTSLTTIKSTSYPVTNFDKFYIEGWFKGVDTGSGIQCQVGLSTYDSSGAYVNFYLAFDNNNGGITSAWKYLRGVIKVPSGSTAAYAGFGVKSTSSNIRFCGLKIHRGDWNVN